MKFTSAPALSRVGLIVDLHCHQRCIAVHGLIRVSDSDNQFLLSAYIADVINFITSTHNFNMNHNTESTHYVTVRRFPERRYRIPI